METDPNSNRASYSPEDNKIRLYVGRVPRDEYLKLRANGWISTPKQSCDFVATWTPSRRDTALEYAGIIEDEDQGPEERAADRAERFGMYRDKRTSEATGHADRYDAGPSAHGYQSQARAERSAARHDRVASRAGDAWSKAEYWQQRTAGVIAHALYKSAPGVRMGRIKTLEAELRKERSEIEQRQAIFKNWVLVDQITDEHKKTEAALEFAGNTSQWSEYLHPRAATHPREYCRTNKLSLYSLLSEEQDAITGAEACALFFSDHREISDENDWTEHLTLRLGYESQMLEAQGGRAAFVEMEAGGWLGKHQIRKVNKSPVTGRVVSVTLKMLGNRWGNESKPGEFYLKAFNIERLPQDAYTPPTDEDRAALKATKATEKAAAPKVVCPLINPNDTDAERLQAIWNERAKAHYIKCNPHFQMTEFKPSTICRITQAQYSANSKGTYARTETVNLCGDACEESHSYSARPQTKYCKIRTTWGDGNTTNKADRVIILTDKPQAALPVKVWEADPLTVESVNA